MVEESVRQDLKVPKDNRVELVDKTNPRRLESVYDTSLFYMIGYEVLLDKI